MKRFDNFIDIDDLDEFNYEEYDVSLFEELDEIETHETIKENSESLEIADEIIQKTELEDDIPEINIRPLNKTDIFDDDF